MLKLFLQTIRERQTLLVIYCLSGIALLWMYIGMFPSMQKQSADFAKAFQSYPPELWEAFGITDINSIFSSVEGFLATEQFSFVWPIIAIALSLGYAGATFAGEIERGTIELILSEPISRIRIFWSKYFAGLTMIIIFTLVSILVAIPLANMYDLTFQPNHFYKVTFLSLLFAWAVYALGLFFSTLFSEKGKVFFITSAILILMYVLNIIAMLKESLESLKYLSYFYYYDASSALISGRLENEAIWFFGLIIIIFSLLAAWRFNTRDIATS